MIVLLLSLQALQATRFWMMKSLPLNIEINPELYTKNPDSSELGQQIISRSIEMIEEMGFEAFTFKKLGLSISFALKNLLYFRILA